MKNDVYTTLAIKALLITSIGVGGATGAFAQSGSKAKVKANDQKPRTELNEAFELNIPERHITETDYNAGVAVELNSQDRNNLHLQVGAKLHADAIYVRLRNVIGNVRFYGSVQRVLDFLDLRLRVTPSTK